VKKRFFFIIKSKKIYSAEAFGSIFVDTVCLPFGSSVNTFGKSRCDLDMLLTFEDFREKNVSILIRFFLIIFIKIFSQ
jgi:hypothetical protein